MPAFACAQCGTKLQVGDDLAGRTCQCPACKTRLVVPAPSSELTIAVPGSRSDPSSRSGDATQASTACADGEASVESVPGSGSAAGSRYVAEQEIARGGMGVVLRAVDRSLRREVALKYMLDDRDPLRRARFVEEAQITGQLEHPNIVPVHELGVDAGGRPFFAMKLVHGRSLAEVLSELRAGAPLAIHGWPLPRLLGVLVNVCHALSYAHSRGVIHRDLKPSNIFLGEFGEVYVMDWGLARLLRRTAGAGLVPAASGSAPPLTSVEADDSSPVDSDRGPSDGAYTVEGTILGTAAYMPPEQARGRLKEIDERSDVYTVGAVLYELLTLQPPIERGDRMQMLLRIVENEVIPPERRAPDRARRGLVPPELSAIALKALAKAPKDRYPTVEALRRDLVAYLDGRAVSVHEDTAARTLIKFVKRNRAASIAAVSVALAVLVSLVVAISAWWVARDAGLETQRAYAATLTAQQEKDDRTRRAVPALLESAQLAIERRRFDAALSQVKVALDYDPQSASARLLKGKLLVVVKDYAGARTELDRYLKQVPADARTRRLRQLIADLRPDAPEALLVLAMEFSQQQQLALAEGVLRAHGKNAAEVQQMLLEPTRKRIEAAWKGLGVRLRIDPLGIYSLDLNNCPQVTSLAPLEGMALTTLQFSNCAGVTDLSPLRGMPLVRLHLQNCRKVHDLSPLKGMPLTTLSLNGCAGVTDLGPLQGLPLTRLDLGNGPAVSDLAPLQGMPLTFLNLHLCKTEDLEPLRGMKLTYLSLHSNIMVVNLEPLRGMPLSELNLESCKRVRDLAALRGMKLTTLNLANCPLVNDLTPLNGMPLTSLYVQGTSVADLTPLRGMSSLATLNLSGTAVTDLSPLLGMPLTWLSLSGCNRLTNLTPLKGMRLTNLDLARTPVNDLEPLRGMPLSSLGLGECRQVRKVDPLVGMRLTNLSLQGSQVEDLTPLHEMPLTSLNLTYCVRLSDLGPLKGMRLRELFLNDNPDIHDLTPLRDMPLETLYLDTCLKLTDLSLLKGMKLHKLTFSPKTATKGVDALRGMATLNAIGPRYNSLLAPAEFWKKYDAGDFAK